MSGVVVEEIRRWQADCHECGWHTREMSGPGAHQEVGDLAAKHAAVCPERKVVPSNRADRFGGQG